jgi:hypothetical protein
MSRAFNTSTAVAAVLVVACCLLACGSSGEKPVGAGQAQRLTGAERGAAQAGHAAFGAYCRRLGL